MKYGRKLLKFALILIAYYACPVRADPIIFSTIYQWTLKHTKHLTGFGVSYRSGKKSGYATMCEYPISPALPTNCAQYSPGRLRYQPISSTP